MSDDRSSNGTLLVMTFLAGAAAGAVVALLAAPRSGRETRDRLRGLGQRAADTVEGAPGAVGDAFARAARAAKETFMTTLRDRMRPGDGPDTDDAH